MLVAFLCAALGACDRAPPAPPKPDTGKPFHANLQGRPIHLVLDDCEVFFVTAEGGRERVLTTDFYPWPSVCGLERISADAGFITVELGLHAFGAGGCCTSQGKWRTQDGRRWERRVQGRWVTPEETARAAERQPEAAR